MMAEPAKSVTVGGRIKICADLNGGVSAFSKETGIPKQTLKNYIANRNDVKGAALQKIADTAGVTVEWILTGKTPPEGKKTKAGADSLVALPVMNVKASAGKGIVAYDEKADSTVFYDGVWLRSKWHLNPNDLYTLPAAGESMEPTIRTGDFLVCSRNEEHVKAGDGIYVVRLDGHVLVKRLQLLPGNRLSISSDNPSYKPFEVALKEGIDFKILGKVVLIHTIRAV